jgi:hypothetical protein
MNGVNVIVITTEAPQLMPLWLSLTLIGVGLILSAVSVWCMSVYVHLTKQDPCTDKSGRYMLIYCIMGIIGMFPILVGTGGIVEYTGSPWYLLLILAIYAPYFCSIIGMDKINKVLRRK